MKKMVISLAAVLLLTGCAQPAAPTEVSAEPSQITEVTEQTQAQPRSFYVPDSPEERSTGGAVIAYQMDDSVTGLAMLGENLLVCTDNRTLHLLAGKALEEIRTRELEGELAWGEPDLRITPDGIAYYDAATTTYVTLDENLVSGPSFVLPSHLKSRPLISSDLSAIYFVTDQGIQVMDLQEGTTRILRQEHEPVTRLGGLMFDSSWLYYTRSKGDDGEQTCFVDASTGSISRTSRFQGRIASNATHFSSAMKVSHAMGQSNWVVVGDSAGPRKMLAVEEGWGDPILLDNGYVILQQRSEQGLELVCYDMRAQQQLGQVCLPQQYNLFAYAGLDGDVLWLSDGASSRFYRWDLAASTQGDTPVTRIQAYASLSQPDTAAMDEVVAQSETLGKQLGMEIAFVQSDDCAEDVNYDEMPDYRPMQYAQALDQLCIAAQRLPEDFRKALELQVELTDRYDPARGMTSSGGSYHMDGGMARISVDMCPDAEAIFYHELFHVLEVQMRNASDGLEGWSELNPDGFSYTGNADSAVRSQQERGAVADGYGMVSPREDRAQIFMYACMSGQQDRFESETMQQKLQFLSGQIRDVFDVGELPVWEQYLHTGDGTETAD